ncbi:MAG: alanine--glyoxylate aminotransferase family protein [Verrucomicrobiota bacterium]|jgi:aspartate aminotransferase-like enzyme|nr:alanine--glyoxylate aminotransferase family protein [Verrucomicrobiota bacterium]
MKLHIPGPVEVSKRTFRAMCAPMIGHRSQDFKELYGKIQPQLQELLATQRPVYLSTSSAWGVMEGAIRNLCNKKLLCCMNGAFSDKWLDVARRSGLNADALQVEWGSPILPDAVDQKLSQGDYDALSLVHNETSTGTMSPLTEIAALKRKYTQVMFIVDTVSSMSAMPLPFDELEIDVMLAGTQKAFALPPGLAVFVCSEAALRKAEQNPNRGYYFDLLEFQKNAEKNMTPSTPSIPHINGLSSQLDAFFEEGLENRYARHSRLAQMTRDWAITRDFTLFPNTGYESETLTCINNGARDGGRTVDVAKLQSLMREEGVLIDGGYGKIKGQAFRLSNMGDETEETMSALYAAMDRALEKL